MLEYAYPRSSILKSSAKNNEDGTRIPISRRSKEWISKLMTARVYAAQRLCTRFQIKIALARWKSYRNSCSSQYMALFLQWNENASYPKLSCPPSSMSQRSSLLSEAAIKPFSLPGAHLRHSLTQAFKVSKILTRKALVCFSSTMPHSMKRYSSPDSYMNSQIQVTALRCVHL
jgi:hypothetical protein